MLVDDILSAESAGSHFILLPVKGLGNSHIPPVVVPLMDLIEHSKGKPKQGQDRPVALFVQLTANDFEVGSAALLCC
jgi:hypothetical protein